MLFVLPMALARTRPAAPPVALASSLEHVVVVAGSDADGQDARRRKKRRVAIDSIVTSSPSTFQYELRPNMSEDTKSKMDEASAGMKAFYSSIRRFGLSVDRGLP